MFLLSVAPGRSSIFISSQLIGIGLSPLLMMSLNSSSRGEEMALAFLQQLHCSTTVLGNPIGMCFSVSKSLKLIRISSSMAVVEITHISARLPDKVEQLNLVVPSTGSLLPSATFNVGLTNLLMIILFLFTMSFLMREGTLCSRCRVFLSRLPLFFRFFHFLKLQYWVFKRWIFHFICCLNLIQILNNNNH